MIYDSFDKVDLYFEKGDKLAKAIKFALDCEPTIEDGRYEIAGDDIYAVVASYQSKPADQLKFEAHEKYIDIQLLLSGEEFVDVAYVQELEIDTPYSAEKDVCFLKQPANFSSVLLKPGRFVVLYPHDAHQPGRMIDKPTNIRKMVVKVKITNKQ